MFKRFDPDSKLAVYYANQLATHRGNNAISPEDLLVGLTWRNHDHDCKFSGLKSDADKLWAGVGIPHLPLSSKPYSISYLPLDRRSKSVLRHMRNDANGSGHYWIDIDHMLVGLLRGKGLAAESLKEAGWTEDRIRVAAAYGRARFPQRPTPQFSKVRIFWDKHGRRTIFALVLAIAAATILYLHSQN